MLRIPKGEGRGSEPTGCFAKIGWDGEYRRPIYFSDEL